GLLQAGGRSRLGDLAGFDVARPAGLRREQPHHPVVGQRSERVDQHVHEVAVAVAVPQQHHVDHLVGVLVDELPDPVDDGVTELVVDVVVVAHLHDHHARLDAEPVQRAAYALSGAASVPAHGLLPPYLGPGLASPAGRPGAQPPAATTPPLARLPGPGPYGRSPPTVARSAPARPSPAGAAAEMAAAARP